MKKITFGFLLLLFTATGFLFSGCIFPAAKKSETIAVPAIETWQLDRENDWIVFGKTFVGNDFAYAIGRQRWFKSPDGKRHGSMLNFFENKTVLMSWWSVEPDRKSFYDPDSDIRVVLIGEDGVFASDVGCMAYFDIVWDKGKKNPDSLKVILLKKNRENIERILRIDFRKPSVSD